MRQAGLEPDAWQQELFATASRFTLLLAHRQAGKSTAVGAMALEAACAAEEQLILLLSRTLRQSGELLRKVKRLYRATEPLPLIQSSALSLELTNGSRIVSLPGTEDTVVGYSAPALIVIDEAARVPDSLFQAVRPMLAMSQGKLMTLSTPWGRRGWYFDAWEGRGHDDAATLDAATVQALLADLGMTVTEDDLTQAHEDFSWTRIKIAAPDNPRLSKRFLANERRSIPDQIFRSEWLCEFIDAQDALFSYDDLTAMLSDDLSPVFGTAAPRDWVSAGVLPLVEEE